MLTTGEPRGRQYRHSLYYSYNFSVHFEIFQKKNLWKKIETTGFSGEEGNILSYS